MQMKLIVIKSLFMLLLIGLSACTFTSVHNDQESDQAKGKLFIDTFYYDIKTKNYDHLLKSTSDSLIKLAGSENFLNLFKNINQKVGDFKGYKVFKVETKRVDKDGNSTVYYRFLNNVEYNKGPVKEEVVLVSEGENKIKIMSYHAYSDLLMKP